MEERKWVVTHQLEPRKERILAVFSGEDSGEEFSAQKACGKFMTWLRRKKGMDGSKLFKDAVPLRAGITIVNDKQEKVNVVSAREYLKGHLPEARFYKEVKNENNS